MPDQKYDMSPRAGRRWIAVVAVAMLVQSGVTSVWAVDQGQRAVAVGSSLIAALLLWRVHRLIPDSPVRPQRAVLNDDERVRFGIAYGFQAALPLFFGSITKELIPGEPGWLLGSGVLFSAGIATGAALILVRRWFRRRRRFTAR